MQQPPPLVAVMHANDRRRDVVVHHAVLYDNFLTLSGRDPRNAKAVQLVHGLDPVS